ncbi:hypothetical protein F4561_006248 [Lipingzhangella halophila]|uniref:Rhamnogalacturonan lyase domain-containing protein n=1 Tax=Lipingzhangella halophila TaxID=1783352 RepID=A0A7W7W6V8_9ACTN|nr:polysaccharide lyase family protein [Lipingzhangella halophila]MBB4935354.1 hypothetical protein [Lipingzhangella halophila]
MSKPQPVTGLNAEGRVGAIDLSWELPGWEPLVDHFAIHASESAEIPTTSDTLVGRTVYGRFSHDTLGVAATTRYYRVVVVDAAGERSEPSAVVRAKSRASMAASGRTLAQVGEFDSKSLELALAPFDASNRFRAAFPDGVDFVYGTSDPATDWCYLHPGPRDGWGGRRAYTFRLRFNLGTVPEGEVGLVIWLIDTHMTLPGTAEVSVNSGLAAVIDLPGGSTRGSLEGDATVLGTALRPHFEELAVSANHFTEGENTIDITKTEGSWHAYDAVGVFGIG